LEAGDVGDVPILDGEDLALPLEELVAAGRLPRDTELSEEGPARGLQAARLMRPDRLGIRCLGAARWALDDLVLRLGTPMPQVPRVFPHRSTSALGRPMSALFLMIKA
jgi:hypothetical protein